jgi:hypothetical protein
MSAETSSLHGVSDDSEVSGLRFEVVSRKATLHHLDPIEAHPAGGVSAAWHSRR